MEPTPLAISDAAPPPQPRRRIPELDGLRGLAILLVLYWHYLGHPLARIESEAATLAAHPSRLASTGVDLFFVLSGFLIGGILLEQRRSDRYFSTFYGRRTLRILPIYFVWLGLFLVLPRLAPRLLAVPGSSELFRDPLPTWSYSTFTQNFAMARYSTFGPKWMDVTWSLAIEEQFYLALPLLIRFIPTRRLPAVLSFFTLLAPLLRLHSGIWNFFTINVLTPWRADSLLLGVLCAWALRRDDLRAALHAHRRELYLLAGGILTVIVPFSLFELSGFLRSPALPLALALLYAAILLIGVTEARGPVSWLLRRRWLQALGGVAYGVYLFHQGINGLVHAGLRGRMPGLEDAKGVLATLLAAALTLALAAASWRWFEKPLVALGQRLSYGEIQEPGQEPAPRPAEPPIG